MKFKFDDDFDDIVIRRNHKVYRNSKDYETDVITDELAYNLSTSKIDNRIVFGYIALVDDEFVFCKYNKESCIFVIYKYNKDDVVIIKTCYKEWRSYTGDRGIEYIDEIPEGK